MSHELRTSLNGIMGYAQVLERAQNLTSEQQGKISTIYQCGSHLLTLINDILDLSKIEARKMELTSTNFHLPSLVQGVVEMCQVRAQQKGIGFNYQWDPQLPLGVYNDEKRLRQVLLNLLSNAIKFTDVGTVSLNIRALEEEWIRFEVQDTGIGMNDQQLTKIFLPFEQVGQGKEQAEGTGLGLAISQRIVEMMGSQIQVRSEIGIGSIFWFDVKMPGAGEWLSPEPVINYRQIIGIENRHPQLLIVDDQPENRAVIKNLLEPIGFRVLEANNGKDGLKKAMAQCPDVIITDLVMPGLDGFSLIWQLRQLQQTKDTIIIASSASVFAADQHQSLVAGSNDFLPKPVQISELLTKLQKYLGLKWVYAPDQQPSSSPAKHSLKTRNELVIPPASEQLEYFQELAQKGNLREIMRQAENLEATDAKFANFAKIVYQLAQEFQDQEILTFLSTYQQEN